MEDGLSAEEQSDGFRGVCFHIFLDQEDTIHLICHLCYIFSWLFQVISPRLSYIYAE